MKRKVQAQRKFAQNACIPTLQNTPPMKIEQSKEERRSIIHNNVPVNNLLDIVAFQSIHPHSKAFVLLERLAPNIDNSAPITNEQKSQQKASLSGKVNKRVQKKKTCKAKNNMRLRTLKKTPSKQIKKPLIVAPVLRRKRNSACYDSEDNMPLNFLKSNRYPVPSSSPSSETSGNANKACLKSKKSVEYVKFSERLVFETDSEPEIRITRSAAYPDKISTPAEKKKAAEKPVQKEAAASKTSTDGAAKPFKEPAIPDRFIKLATVHQKKKIVPVTPASTTKKPFNKNVTAETSRGPVPEAAKLQYYGSSGIVNWLNSNKGAKGANAKPAIKRKVPVAAVAEVPQKKQKESSPARSLSPCPSESLRTVRDVIGASPSMMSKRCQHCQSCTRVNVVEQISNIVQSSRRRPERNDDVYEFDGSDETVDPLPIFLNKRRHSRAQEKDFTTSDEEEEHLYLDLQKDSPQIIEITSVKLPNTTKKMMKARLIPKSEAHTAEDFSLIKHENILDQLLQTLTINVNFNDMNESEAATTDKTSPDGGGNNAQRPGRLAKRRYTMKPVIEEPLKGATDKTSPERPGRPKKRRVTFNPATEESPKKTAKLVEAPTFYPTEAEFNDPIAYIEKITPIAAKYGLCKVKAPESFKPKCILNDDLKFNVTNHYVARMFSRWGSAAREICAIRAYLATQNINFNRVPLLDSLEVNLPKLYSVVQRNGGLEQVLEKKRWSRVAEEMRFSKGPNAEKTLDNYYVKYLLPYDTASNQERTTIKSQVEKCWNTKNRKSLEWSSNPLHLQRKLLGESDSSEEEETNDDSIAVKALHEAEDCVVAGRPMHLSGFKKVAAHAMTQNMGTTDATAEEIEKEYWRLVLFGTEHVCVNAASIDTAASGYGFSKNKNHPGGKHPWNLKNLSANNNNVLSSLSAVLGVTVPTLHLGMVFSTCCWHRDPHGLPWMEYMHEGPPKIWYGIPDEQSDNFRKAVEVLCPTSCQNKYIWLSSDITMIPPNLLREHKVSLSRTVQNPGEFIVVFPKSYSCSISTGFTVSESVYFATNSWLKTVHQVFQELRSSCEPTTFSLEQLLFALAKDPRSSFGVLHTVHSSLTTIVDEELRHRNTLTVRGATVSVRNQAKKRNGAAWNVREQDECKICRSTLYLSKVTGVLSKKSDLCLTHAIRIIEKRKSSKMEVSKMELILFYTEKQLAQIMQTLKKRLYPS